MFWKKFRKTREWQENLVKFYKKHGYVKDFSWGFERHGYVSRNQIFNFPIQGPAFHCLQWTINELVLRVKLQERFESLICGQIHDAIFNDVKKGEFKKYRKKVDHVMLDKVREENPWIIVPLENEWAVGPNWLEMEEVE